MAILQPASVKPFHLIRKRGLWATFYLQMLGTKADFGGWHIARATRYSESFASLFFPLIFSGFCDVPALSFK